MKKNTYDIDNRAKWKMKRLIHENTISDDELDDLYYFKSSKSNLLTKNRRAFSSVIHSFKYMFN